MKALCSKGPVLALIHDGADRQPAEASGADLAMLVGIRAAEIKIGNCGRPVAGSVWKGPKDWRSRDMHPVEDHQS